MSFCCVLREESVKTNHKVDDVTIMRAKFYCNFFSEMDFCLGGLNLTVSDTFFDKIV